VSHDEILVVALKLRCPRCSLSTSKDAESPSSVDGAYPGEFTEARLGITAQDGPTGFSRVRGDDQVVCAARGTGSADMGEQASVVSSGRLRVVKDIDGGCYRHECPGAFGCSAGRIRRLDPNAVLGNRYRRTW